MAYKGFDGASINAIEGRWATLHQLEAGAVGVVEGPTFVSESPFCLIERYEDAIRAASILALLA